MSTGGHLEACHRAASWLLSRSGENRHALALVEPRSGVWHEMPDVLAWDIRGKTTLVEVKLSRSDFLADRKKPTRQDDGGEIQFGLGARRWYFAPHGLLHPEDMPHGWGLAELSKTGKTVRIRKEPEEREPHAWRHQQETYMLLMCARRANGYPKVMKVDPESMEIVRLKLIAEVFNEGDRSSLAMEDRSAQDPQYKETE